MMPAPPDAATLAQVKAALEKITKGPWTIKIEIDDEVVLSSINIESTHLHDHDVALVNALAMVVNAAPALVAGCETLAKVETLIGDLMNEARRLREAAVDDDQNDRWIAAGERENLACRLRDLCRLAALDAAREE